jgi:hypothetical protein
LLWQSNCISKLRLQSKMHIIFYKKCIWSSVMIFYLNTTSVQKRMQLCVACQQK